MLTLSIAVAPQGSSTIPTGSVTVLSGSTQLGTAALSGGLASFSTSSLGVGTYSITVEYSGDSNFNGSTSAVTTITIQAAPTPDFALSVSGASLNVAAGTSGKLSVTVTPENGFKQAVSFTCSGLPSSASCSFSPQSLTPAGSPVSTVVTVQVPQTKAAALVEDLNARVRFAGHALALRGAVAWAAQYSIALSLWAIAILFARRRRKNGAVPETWGFRLSQALVAALAIASFAGGCASIHTQPVSVPPQNYTMTITATGANAPTHSQTITLTIEQ
jgi:hypothetical protein